MNRFLLFLASVIIFGLSHAETRDCLTIFTKDGAKTTMLLTKQPKVTFDEANLVLTMDSETIVFPLCDVAGYGFTDAESSVTESTVNTKSIRFDGDSFVLSGFEKDARVSIFSIDGRLIYSSQVKDLQTTIPAGHISDKVLLINVDGFTFKVMKR